MPRTGPECKQRVRELVHDTGRGFATANFMYEDEDIYIRLNDAKRRIAKALIERPASPTGVGGAAIVTLSRIIKICSATNGTTAPDDFWYLIAGIDSDNGYVPRVHLPVGEALKDVGHSLVYVKGGIFQGYAQTALYWAYPTEVISTAQSALTQFPDGFYDAVELLAARDLLPQEPADALDRWKLLSDLFMEAIAAFK